MLEYLTVRLVCPEESPLSDEWLVKEPCLRSAQLVGEHLRYMATHQGQRLALMANKHLVPAGPARRP